MISNAAITAGIAQKKKICSTGMCIASNRLPNSGPRIEPNRPTPKAQPVPVARTWAG